MATKRKPTKAGAKKTKKRSSGRPKAEIDWGLVPELGEIGCTEEEVASVLRISRDTLLERCKSDHGKTFKDYYWPMLNEGNVSLRRHQWRVAKEGNPALLIWLGKNKLGQSDKIKNEVTGEDGGPIKIETAREELASILGALVDEEEKK